MSSFLETIPNELLDLIIEELGLSDLAALHRCSSALKHQLEPALYGSHRNCSVAMHWACKRGSADVLHKAAFLDPSTVDCVWSDQGSWQATLWVALDSGKPAMFKILLELGARFLGGVNIINKEETEQHERQKRIEIFSPTLWTPEHQHRARVGMRLHVAGMNADWHEAALEWEFNPEIHLQRQRALDTSYTRMLEALIDGPEKNTNHALMQGLIKNSSSTAATASDADNPGIYNNLNLQTCLEGALSNGWGLEIIKFLLDRHTDTPFGAWKLGQLMSQALQSGSQPVWDLILAQGANVHGSHLHPFSTTRPGRPPRPPPQPFLTFPIFATSQYLLRGRNGVEALQWCLDQGADLNQCERIRLFRSDLAPPPSEVEPGLPVEWCPYTYDVTGLEDWLLAKAGQLDCTWDPLAKQHAPYHPPKMHAPLPIYAFLMSLKGIILEEENREEGLGVEGQEQREDYHRLRPVEGLKYLLERGVRLGPNGVPVHTRQPRVYEEMNSQDEEEEEEEDERGLCHCYNDPRVPLITFILALGRGVGCLENDEVFELIDFLARGGGGDETGITDRYAEHLRIEHYRSAKAVSEIARQRWRRLLSYGLRTRGNGEASATPTPTPSAIDSSGSRTTLRKWRKEAITAHTDSGWATTAKDTQVLRCTGPAIDFDENDEPFYSPATTEEQHDRESSSSISVHATTNINSIQDHTSLFVNYQGHARIPFMAKWHTRDSVNHVAHIRMVLPTSRPQAFLRHDIGDSNCDSRSLFNFWQ